jgi:hypothetical protein
MEFEFDKEIDALLRQTRRGGVDVVSAQAHLDADEISAFAENALNEKTKLRYTAHLADCTRCRKILSNLILLESEQETASAAVSSPVKEVAAPASPATAIPWYWRIFAMPNLAYTMGALVLLFSGLIAFIVLQSPNNVQNQEVSQMSENSSDSKSAGSAPHPAMSNMANSVMTANSSTNSNAASVYTSNTATTAETTSISPSGPLSSSNANMAAKPPAVETRNLPAAPMPEDESLRDREKDLAKTETQTSDLIVTGKSVKEENKTANEIQNRTDDSDVAARKQEPKPNVAQPSLSADGVSSTVAGNDKKVKKPASEKSGEGVRAVGGKNFNRRNKVWYDAAYNGQSTINVVKGSAEYKKLDSGLRRTAENLGGTVVIVWKSKAYRIQ